MSNKIEEAKKIAAYKACEKIKENMKVGLGTGSTAYYAIERCAELQKEGLKFICVASSSSTEEIAKSFNLELTSVYDVAELDIYIDGVDEIDPYFNAIKGGGAALFREKILASIAKEVYWVMDDRKLVSKLGQFPLPLEVLPFATRKVIEQLDKWGLSPSLRPRYGKLKEAETLEQQVYNLSGKDFEYLLKDGPYLVTDNGNFIVDCFVRDYLPLTYLNEALNSLSGVLEHGLFLNYCQEIFVAHKDGSITNLYNKFANLRNVL